MDRNAMLRTVAGMVVGVLAVGAVAIGTSYAQQPSQPRGQLAVRGRGMMPPGPLAAMRRGLAQLGLSEEQRQQVRSILQGRQAEVRALGRQMQLARRSVADAIADDAGEAVIRARSAELAKLQADMAVLRAEIRKQVFAVLTSEQQAKAKELRRRVNARFERLQSWRRRSVVSS